MRVNARAVWYDGHRFGSVKERDTFIGFQALQRDGEISALQAHPTFAFEIHGVKIGRPYVADGSYIETATNKLHVYDVKGFRLGVPTKKYPCGKPLPRVDKGWAKIKGLMLAIYGIQVDIL